ncbi:hypothetical protein BN133_3658 [Cronobacter dublinensis 582]|nr:hypothetical protein BN133_3658 [Cronobacter dublinensis 582]
MIVQKDVKQLAGVDQQRIQVKTGENIAGTLLERIQMIFIEGGQRIHTLPLKFELSTRAS